MCQIPKLNRLLLELEMFIIQQEMDKTETDQSEKKKISHTATHLGSNMSTVHAHSVHTPTY